MPFLASEGCFWPLTASMTSEVKNKYAYNIPQDICNKLIEVKNFVGCMVPRPNRIVNHWTSLDYQWDFTPTLALNIVFQSLPLLMRQVYTKKRNEKRKPLCALARTHLIKQHKSHTHECICQLSRKKICRKERFFFQNFPFYTFSFLMHFISKLFSKNILF